MIDVDKIEYLNQVLSKMKKALIVTHEFPDIDAIGSSLAMYHYLLSQGIEVKVWTAQKLGEVFDFLPGVKNIVHTYPDKFDFDGLFVLDASHLTRVRQHKRIQIGEATVINIDHHSDNSEFGDVNIVQDISSVGELLYWIFDQNRWKVTPEIATSLYAAISFDTGRFGYSNTTAKTLEAAASLVSYGASPYDISQAMDENRKKADFELMQLGFERLVTLDDVGIAYTTVPQNAGAEANIKLIDVVRQLQGYKVILVFQEIDSKKVKVNLRSKSDFDVSAFAQKFGGGGHVMASGIFMESTLVDAEKNIVEALTEALAGD